MAPKPPFGTDEPDSFYESPQHPQRRLRQPPPPDPNNRSSAYDLYDSYFDAGTNRQSGMDAVGLGFLTGDMDDSDDEDSSNHGSKQAEALPDKHAALAAATGVRKASPTPPPQYIAAPRPGYAAPIAALNLAKPDQTAVPNGRPLNHEQHQQNIGPNYSSPSPISVSGTPHPLEAPVTPITPAFARPRPPKGDVHFSDKTPILRGNSEEKLIPKRGDAGDDFWRRFSMVAKEEGMKNPAQKQSAWLRKTQNGTNKLAIWVWIVGLIIILAAAGGIGLGWYLSHNAPSHQQPTTFGGSASEAAGSTTTARQVAGTGTVTAKTPLHVSPTNTVKRRVLEARATNVASLHRRRSNKH
ncbi:hypothetical protein C8J56DRAFT_847539 [Mycena floridula]|nr:hypothetical protein C8J56DRAFT_847539 [Mycena floridula]